MEVLNKRKNLIAALSLDFGVKAIDVYLDAYNEYKRMLREFYVKMGVRKEVDEDQMTFTFLSMFYKGHLMENAYYEEHWIGECILYSFYVELMKKAENLALKPVILNILAVNGSQDSEVYQLIVNDKATRDKQEKLEENTKRIKYKSISVAA